MYLVVGLGNPGRDFAGSRHNAGFSLIYEMSDRFRIDVIAKEHLALTGWGLIEGKDVILAMPQTYMNLSGDSVARLVRAYDINVSEELIVAYDDTALELGRLRIRRRGSAGGHNGMKDIIRALGTDEFIRVRIGIGGRPEKLDLKDFVLGTFESDEQEKIREAVSQAASAVVMIMTAGPEAAMNEFNPYRQGAEEDAAERARLRDEKEEELDEARKKAEEESDDEVR